MLGGSTRPPAMESAERQKPGQGPPWRRGTVDCAVPSPPHIPVFAGWKGIRQLQPSSAWKRIRRLRVPRAKPPGRARRRQDGSSPSTTRDRQRLHRREPSVLMQAGHRTRWLDALGDTGPLAQRGLAGHEGRVIVPVSDCRLSSLRESAFAEGKAPGLTKQNRSFFGPTTTSATPRPLLAELVNLLPLRPGPSYGRSP